MKTLPLLLSVLALFTAQLRAESPAPSGAFHREATPAAGKVSADLFWVADTRKMDVFLANVQLPNLHAGAYAGEVLPDTRVAWRDYASEAKALARKGSPSEAAAKLAQMLKLAAVYRSFGGLQNVVQGEEIRYLAGLTAADLGPTIAARIKSPYLEADAGDCLMLLEAQAGAEKAQVTPFFWRHLEQRAVDTHFRLSTGGNIALAAKP
jgi:hypothetical protein